MVFNILKKLAKLFIHTINIFLAVLNANYNKKHVITKLTPP